jgi:hypothetical protein
MVPPEFGLAPSKMAWQQTGLMTSRLSAMSASRWPTSEGLISLYCVVRCTTGSCIVKGQMNFINKNLRLRSLWYSLFGAHEPGLVRQVAESLLKPSLAKRFDAHQINELNMVLDQTCPKLLGFSWELFYDLDKSIFDMPKL